MDTLHAAIAAYLRERNTRLPAAPAPVDRIWTGTLRRHGGPPVTCRICGRPILNGDGLFEIETLREDRLCADHYVPF